MTESPTPVPAQVCTKKSVLCRLGRVWTRCHITTSCRYYNYNITNSLQLCTNLFKCCSWYPACSSNLQVISPEVPSTSPLPAFHISIYRSLLESLGSSQPVKVNRKECWQTRRAGGNFGLILLFISFHGLSHPCPGLELQKEYKTQTRQG